MGISDDRSVGKNRAGHGYRAALEEGEPAAVAELFQTNFFGPVELIKLVLPAMREQKYGVIVNVSSIGAVTPGLGSGYYQLFSQCRCRGGGGRLRGAAPAGRHAPRLWGQRRVDSHLRPVAGRNFRQQLNPKRPPSPVPCRDGGGAGFIL